MKLVAGWVSIAEFEEVGMEGAEAPFPLVRVGGSSSWGGSLVGGGGGRGSLSTDVSGPL